MNESALPALTSAEKVALQATELPSFPVNLEEIRRTVANLLHEFGRYGFFDEYTTHNFEHVYGLLRALDWLIPKETKALLTKGDWWLLTMACYLHDLGLIVTRDEFNSRHESQFDQFCHDVLFTGPEAEDYRSKVDKLGPEAAEKFYYQEFVRYHHASRIRAWINGSRSFKLGKAEAVAGVLDGLLKPLSSAVRNDLAMVCESHNLKDLDDETKYPPFRPYGTSDDETVNVHYAALMLRTADLVQITNMRAPTVLFKTINPRDPISQREWLKQNAVTRIRPMPKEDRSGAVSSEIQPDTIQVFADFKQAEGFFGLTSYLNYAQRELEQSFALAENAKKRAERKLSFPWRYIDDSHVKAEGFEPKQFHFEIDQKKVLDLLTGHTLYNDSAVVLRELTQNAIDAVRLQAQEEGRPADEVGKVLVRWDSATSELEILDNGTGMTQSIIENHLLKVGSSRYQDEEFKEGHPNFSPISRFGIGVLSAFMIADEVEFVTCASNEKEARHISLRTVHGRYLIRLLDKDEHPLARRVGSHGTSVKLRLRDSAKRPDVLHTIRRWVVIPGCTVTVQADADAPVNVGFGSPKEVLNSYLNLSGERLRAASFKVVQKDTRGTQCCVLVEHNEYLDEWSFVRAGDQHFTSDGTPISAICVEGIMVEPGSPGYERGGILAIANATGSAAPKTNVARSSLEDTDEKIKMIEKTYELYVSHLRDEVSRMLQQREYPLSRVIAQLPYISSILNPDATRSSVTVRPERVDNQISYPLSLRQAFSTLPVFLVEDAERRAAESINDLTARGTFWTVASALMSSLEDFISLMPVDVTARDLFKFTEGKAPRLPNGALVSNLSSTLAKSLAFEKFEVVRMRALQQDHRLELEWGSRDQRWLSSDAIEERLGKLNYRIAALILEAFEANSHQYRLRWSPMASQWGFKLPLKTVPAEGLDEYAAVTAFSTCYFLSDSGPLRNLVEAITSDSFDDVARAYVSIRLAMGFFTARGIRDAEQYVDERARVLGVAGIENYVSALEIKSICSHKKWNNFNPLAWARTSNAQ